MYLVFSIPSGIVFSAILILYFEVEIPLTSLVMF